LNFVNFQFFNISDFHIKKSIFFYPRFFCLLAFVVFFCFVNPSVDFSVKLQVILVIHFPFILCSEPSFSQKRTILFYPLKVSFLGFLRYIMVILFPWLTININIFTVPRTFPWLTINVYISMFTVPIIWTMHNFLRPISVIISLKIIVEWDFSACMEISLLGYQRVPTIQDFVQIWNGNSSLIVLIFWHRGFFLDSFY